MNIAKVIFVLLIGCLFLFLIQFSLTKKKEETTIVFFGLGKADSIYIENQKQRMLIDTGLEETSEQLTMKLKQLGVTKIDYLLLTHNDKDHIGGAAKILENFEVKTLLESTNEQGTKREEKIRKIANNQQIPTFRMIQEQTFNLGELKVTIFPSGEKTGIKDNDYSLVTLIEDRKLRYLFAGDIEEVASEQLLQRQLSKVDLYKVPHHGRVNPSSEKLIQQLSPKNAVITNRKKTGEVASFLEDERAAIWYVFEQDFCVVSDGENLSGRFLYARDVKSYKNRVKASY